MQKSILIVDDDSLVCEIYGDSFSHNGFKVYTALSGAKALEQIKKETPDIVLADVVMPKMSGIEMYQNAKLLDPDLPFVFMTGYDYNKEIIAALEQIEATWISKPIELVEILQIINNKLELKAKQN